MTWSAYLLVAVFLPLFPASMLFNRLFAAVGNVWFRMALLLVWPQPGLMVLAALDKPAPGWIVYWAVLTAGLYAFRALALRDLGLWTAHMATSAWSLLWVVALYAPGEAMLILQAVVFSAPFVVLAFLVSRLASVFGAAYAGVHGGLARTVPRLSLLLVLVILAVVATPPFPGFFMLLAMMSRSLDAAPLAAPGVLVIWLLWAWAGARMTRGMVVGPACAEARPDLSLAATVPSGIVLALLAVAGVTSVGYLL